MKAPVRFSRGPRARVPLWMLALTLCLLPSLAFACHDCLLNTLYPTSGTNGPTHVALGGNWSTAASWSPASVPGTGARVHIPAGVTVQYPRNDSTTALAWVRVDGTLKFSTGANTAMRLDTLYVAASGALEIGTPTTPVSSSYDARILFTGGVIRSDDSQMISRGLVAVGSVTMHGAVKRNFVASTATPGVDASSFALSETVPGNWVAGATTGDELVITGTSWAGSEANFSRDEVVRLTGKSGSTITFSPPLAHARTLPSGQGMKIYVANLTRNITLESEDTTATQQRAHAMFMSAATDIRYVCFKNMGRTDKNALVTDPGLTGTEYTDNPNDDLKLDLVNSKANARGRYPVHLHKPGVNAGIANFVGLSVINSPGWGIAIHDGEAVVEDCVTYDVLGTHYMTEIGNERVWWRRNIAIRARGATASGQDIDMLQVDATEKGRRADWGSEGIGFWLHTTYTCQEFTGNVAAGMADVGCFVWGKNDDDTPNNPKLMIPASKFSSYAAAAAGSRTEIPSTFVPVRLFKGFEALNASGALHLAGPLRDDDGLDQQLTQGQRADGTLPNFSGHGHRLYSLFEDVRGAQLRTHGIKTDYASYMHLKDVVLISKAYPGTLSRPDGSSMVDPQGAGIWQQKNGRFIKIENPTVRGWHTGVRLGQTYGQSLQVVSENFDLGATELIGGVYSNNVWHLYPSVGRVNDGSQDTKVLNRPPFAHHSRLTGTMSFSDLGGSPPVAANFTVADLGGRAYLFDGSASQDPDYTPEVLSDNAGSPISTNDIASYTWDVTANGTIEGHGRFFKFVFSTTGTFAVKLTVRDASGKTASYTKNVTVVDSAYTNRVSNGSFSASAWRVGTGSWTFDKYDRWQYNDGNTQWSQPGTYMESASNGDGDLLVQVVRDDKTLRGTGRQLTFKYWRQTTSPKVRVQIWGTNQDYFKGDYSSMVAPVTTLATVPLVADSVLPATLVSSGSTGVWLTSTHNLADLGTGYKYLVIMFESQSASSGNAIRIDDVVLK